MSLLNEGAGTALAALERPSPTERPRVLYLITRAERGGAQVHVLDLVLGMRREFDVVVATGEEGYLADSCRQRGIPVHVVSHLGREIDPVADLRGLREIVHLLRGVKPDLVHSHTFKRVF
jgi:Glycosyl transferase 4-like domain